MADRYMNIVSPQYEVTASIESSKFDQPNQTLSFNLNKVKSKEKSQELPMISKLRTDVLNS